MSRYEWCKRKITLNYDSTTFTNTSGHYEEKMNNEKSPVRKSVESGIKTNDAYFLAARMVSFKIDHPCLKTDTFSIPESKFTTMLFF